MMKTKLATLVLYGVLTLPAAAQNIGDVVSIDTTLANIRSGPGTEFQVQGQLPENTVMAVSNRRGDWALLSDPLNRGMVTGWINAGLLRVHQGTQAAQSPASPAPAAQSAPVPRLPRYPSPVAITDTDFDCEEDMFNGGYKSCALEVEVSIQIPGEYKPFMKDYVEINCEAEIDYKRANSFMTSTEREDETASIYLYGTYSSDTIEIDFDFNFGLEPVISARLTSVECAPY